MLKRPWKNHGIPWLIYHAFHFFFTRMVKPSLVNFAFFSHFSLFLKNKMFKKNVKGMQQNIKREFWLGKTMVFKENHGFISMFLPW